MYGFEEGDVCQRNSCTGIIEIMTENCYCSVTSDPPCHICEAGIVFCPECGWESPEYDQESDEDNIYSSIPVFKLILSI